jgi:hypothetical protein
MDFVLIYSIFVGAIFLFWLLFMLRMYHKMNEKE